MKAALTGVKDLSLALAKGTATSAQRFASAGSTSEGSRTRASRAGRLRAVRHRAFGDSSLA